MHATIINMTRTRTAFAALAATFALLLVPSPAHADSPTPTLDYPLARIADTVDVEVMIESPAKAWGVRRSAKFYDAAVDGLTIHTRGTCYARPQAICVRVHIDSYSAEEMLTISHGLAPSWNGLTNYDLGVNDNWDVATSPRSIYLNTRSVPRGAYGRLIARHELGHALGLAHHSADEGVMVGDSGGGSMWPSVAELDALRAWYSAPRA